MKDGSNFYLGSRELEERSLYNLIDTFVPVRASVASVVNGIPAKHGTRVATEYKCHF